VRWIVTSDTLPRVTIWWIATVALVLVGGVALTFGLLGSARALPGPAPSAAALRDAVVTPPTERPLSTVRSVPVTLQIPSIGLSVSMGTSLGLNADGTVQVPVTTTRPGWFRLGPTPGQVGSSVILGHVDNYLGPGVFFQLRTLASGDRIDVGLADGATAQFTVDSVAMYSKQQFPAQRVYGSDGSSELQLVTCGGVFDHQTGSYLSNIVVYSSLTSVTPVVEPKSTLDPAMHLLP
jgi:sortase (surface protein transpeptidase)